MDPIKKLLELSDSKARMLDYLHLKVQEQDWHGVADAAMDLREIEQATAVWSVVRQEKFMKDDESTLANEHGMTLLELLICLVILGILLPFMGRFMMNMSLAVNKAIAATKQLQTAQVLQATQPAHSQVVFNEQMDNSTLTPIVCFDANGKPNSCTINKDCAFDPQQGWQQHGKACAYGVLLVY